MSTLRSARSTLAVALVLVVAGCTSGDSPLGAADAALLRRGPMFLGCTTPTCIRPINEQEQNAAWDGLQYSLAMAYANSDMTCVNVVIMAQEYMGESQVNEDPVRTGTGEVYVKAQTPYTGPTTYSVGYASDSNIHIHEAVHRIQRSYETESQYSSYPVPWIADEDYAASMAARGGY